MKLQPLDPNMLIALAREENGQEDVDEGLEHPLNFRVRDIRRLIAEDKDWGIGVNELVWNGVRVGTWMGYTTRPTAEERKGNNEWYIELLVGIVHLRHTKQDR